MEFRIADTFTDSLSRLTGDEQKAVKTTAFDLQLNPAGAGKRFHKIDKAKDKNFWSVRVNADIRLIVHKTPGSLLLCYVDHHDKAYDWAERRKMHTHPETGAAELVEIRETVEEVIVPVYRQKEPAAERKPIFHGVSNDELLCYGVPHERLNDVRKATVDTLLVLADHLPAEAAEALLDLATGGKPRMRQPAIVATSPFDHPDAQRHFRVMGNVEELHRALDFPGEKWTVFRHRDQRAAKMKSEPIDECETKEGRSWVVIGIDEALSRRGDPMRCPECHGPVSPHKAGSTSQRAHFEHRRRHTGCSLKPHTFSGVRSMHPDALA